MIISLYSCYYLCLGYDLHMQRLQIDEKLRGTAYLGGVTDLMIRSALRSLD